MSDTPAPAGHGGDGMEPGDPRAREYGCSCSVLANARYRARRDASPLVDPTCRVHAMPSRVTPETLMGREDTRRVGDHDRAEVSRGDSPCSLQVDECQACPPE